MQGSSPQEGLEETVAQRLVSKARQGRASPSLRSLPAAPGDPSTTESLPTRLVRAEKNLISLAFFTPSSKRIKDTKAKTISFSRTEDGHRVEARATILPSAFYGLPATADLDKYLAFQQLIMDKRRREGIVTNPIRFSSAELLAVLGQSDSGTNYAEITDWLKLMRTTSIVSEGAVYFAGRKRWVSDTFGVFDRVVVQGDELPDGSVAQVNEVTLSEWQLNNINRNHLIPIDFETYLGLQNHIARVLLPQLQIWFYASREQGSFEKRYDELAQVLGVTQYQHASRIKQQLGPSLDELKAQEYLARWSLRRAKSDDSFKLVFQHGAKFYRDLRLLSPKEGPVAVPSAADAGEAAGGGGESHIEVLAVSPAEPTLEEVLVGELVKRGVMKVTAQDLVAQVPADYQLLDALEWGDHQVGLSPKKFRNPAGFYIHLVKNHVQPPADFETSRRRALRQQAADAREAKARRQAELQMAYDDYRSRELDRHIAENYTPDQWEAELVKERQALLVKQPTWRRWQSGALDGMVLHSLRASVARQVSLLDFQAFCAREGATPGPQIELGWAQGSGS